jgi:biopolymer transport protein ExbD
MELFKRRRIEAHIDMTPMIDTLLQLFLIFMLGASLASSSIDIDLPRAHREATPRDLSRAVTVSIDAESRVYLDKRQIPRGNLRAELTQLVRSSRELTVLLQADKRLVYEQIIQVMAEVQQTGASKVMLAYYPERTPTTP